MEDADAQHQWSPPCSLPFLMMRRTQGTYPTYAGPQLMRVSSFPLVAVSASGLMWTDCQHQRGDEEGKGCKSHYPCSPLVVGNCYVEEGERDPIHGREPTQHNRGNHGNRVAEQQRSDEGKTEPPPAAHELDETPLGALV